LRAALCPLFRAALLNEALVALLRQIASKNGAAANNASRRDVTKNGLREPHL
jgi:hypothetical protein